MNKFFTSLCLLLAAWTLPAKADLILTLSSGNSSVVVIDESPTNSMSSGGSYTSTVNDSLNGAGIVGFNGAVGNFSVNITTGISSPLIGPYAIDLNNVSVSGAAGTLTIEMIDTDFSVATPGVYELLSEFGGTTDGSISATGGVLDSNAEVGFGSDVFQGPFSQTPFSEADSADVFLSNSFSLNTIVTITHDGAGQVSGFDHKLSVAVPEPGACAVLCGIIGMVCLRRRRRKPGKASRNLSKTLPQDLTR